MIMLIVSVVYSGWLTREVMEVLISCSNGPLTSKLTPVSDGGTELYVRQVEKTPLCYTKYITLQYKQHYTLTYSIIIIIIITR